MKRIAFVVIAVFVVIFVSTVAQTQETAKISWIGATGYFNFENGEVSVLQKLPKAGFGGPSFGKITHDTIITLCSEGKSECIKDNEFRECRNFMLLAFNNDKVMIIGRIEEKGEGEGMEIFARELMILKLSK